MQREKKPRGKPRKMIRSLGRLVVTADRYACKKLDGYIYIPELDDFYDLMREYIHAHNRAKYRRRGDGAAERTLPPSSG